MKAVRFKGRTRSKEAQLRLSVPRLALVALAAALAAPVWAAAAPARPAPVPSACTAAIAGGVAGLTVSAARPVEAAGEAPAYCEVVGTASPVARSHIGVVFRMPFAWNGKVVGLGGGGWAGNVNLNTALPALRMGYATFQTDGGHPSPNGTDASWSILAKGQPNAVALDDFAWRAVHEMTVAGKALVRAFYGAGASRAYFQGCSTGGRMGLMEVQRFPDDYDGVIAGAPVYDLRVQTSALWRTQIFHKDPESNLTAALVPAINKAVLAACDTLDGAADGIVADPRACKWDPVALQCKASASADCLTPKQVAAVRAAYAGYTTRAGKIAAFPLMRGSELDWIGRSVGDAQNPLGGNMATGARGLQYFVYADPDYDVMKWDPEKDFPAAEAHPYAKVYEAANTDIRPFLGKGRKLLLWHGGYDPGPSPLGTIAYYEAAARTAGPAAANMRLFLAPGVFHCGGGPGTDRFDMLSALDAWVEGGPAPASIPARNATSGVTRPLCPYPEQPRYQGGDLALAASFRCGRS
jgi:feruloyl esterase